MKWKLCLVSVFAIFVSCSFTPGTSLHKSSAVQIRENNFIHDKADWTVMVYMPADNNLEEAALEDLNEMEAAEYDEEKLNVVVLLDTDGFNDGIDDWPGTRLYEVKHDKSGMNQSLCSIRLGSPELGLSSRTDKELNMADKRTMCNFIKYVKKNYPAEHFALVVWGHGTGYRSLSKSNTRAVAIDDTSSSFMPIPTLRDALEQSIDGEKLDFLGFDTCFASEIEVMYELKDTAHYFVGEEGTQPVSGWDYCKWLGSGFSYDDSGLELGKKLALISNSDSHLCVADLSNLENLFLSFDEFALKFAKAAAEKKSVVTEKLKGVQSFKSYGAALNPVYIDVVGMVRCGMELFPSLKESAEDVEKLLGEVCVLSKNENIGVYFGSVKSNGIPASEFSPYYVQGSGVSGQCEFVKKSKGYVPSSSKENKSLLDVLF